MTNAPEIPDEFDSEEELKAYIDQLHDQIEFLEEEVEESEKEKLELKQELNKIEEQASRGGGLQDIHAALEEFIETVEDIDTHGEPSDVGLHDSLRNPDFKS
jgi:predicted  nucleic acid-binding Zn-ribbon protein